MRWVIAALSLAIVLLAAALPEIRQGQWALLWDSLGPNLLAGAISLLAAVGVADVWLRKARLQQGVRKLGPAVFKSVFPAIAADTEILKGLEMTPNEFKQVHREYLDGRMNPIHIPATFKNQLEASCQRVSPGSIQKAEEALAQTEEFAGKFAGLLEPEHLLLLNRAVKNWQDFRAQCDRKPRDRTDLAEAYLDAHDALTDLNFAFDFDSAMKQLRGS